MSRICITTYHAIVQSVCIRMASGCVFFVVGRLLLVKHLNLIAVKIPWHI